MLNKKRENSKSSIYLTPIKKRKISEKTFSIEKINKSDNVKTCNANQLTEKIINKFNSKKKVKKSKTLSIQLNSFNPYTIEELHSLALANFNKIKKEKNVTYIRILKEVIKYYDLDEEINAYFLDKLYEYYINNKKKIDNSKDGKSDEVVKYFYKFIFTLGKDKRQTIYNKFNFFDKNEIFTEDDKRFIYKDSMKITFEKFINELLKISLTINNKLTEKKSEEYSIELANLYSKYQFPVFSLKIPLKYGNEDLIYIEFILRLQKIFCTKETNNKKNIFSKYDIKNKFMALNYFSEYFSLKEYDISSIQYIIFSIYVFFRFYNEEIYALSTHINFQFFICSRFIYQNFEEKKKYIKEIKEYIQNDFDLESINENYLEKNLLRIKYNNKEILVNANNCYFLGNKEIYMEDLINKKNYNFLYLKKKNFPLFYDNDELNNDFNSYIKLILQSNLTFEYTKSFKNIPKLNESIFSDKIFNEIKENTMWVRFPIKNVQGLTDREIYNIYLNNDIVDIEDLQFSTNISSKIITNVHEDSNHVLRLILSINNTKITKTTPKIGDIFRLKKYNDISKLYDDQGDIWEHIIFGHKLHKIYIMGSLLILDSDNFKLNLNEFQKVFYTNNIKQKIKDLNEILKKAKKNNNNKLLKYIKEFDENSNDDWLLKEQNIVGRNYTINSESWQCYNFSGVCGTHGYELNNYN